MSTHKKDSLADPLVAESKETAELLEKIPSKKDFNTDHNGPGSMPINAESTLESNNVNLAEKGSPNETDNHSSHPKKSKDTNNTRQDGLANQAEPKSSNTGCKESEIDGQWIFLDTVPDFMKCKICSSVFESPQLLSCCGTNICKKCMDRHLQRLATLADQQPSCPFCRRMNFKLINNAALEQTINQLKVQCCYQCKGCGWTGILENGNLHLQECAFIPINCPNRCGCEQFERHRLSDHMLTCPCTHTTCSFETIGCDVKTPLFRQAAQKHASDCLSQHLLLVAQRNIQLLKDYRHFCTSLQSESYVNIANGELVKTQREVLASTKHTIKSLKESLQEIQKRTTSLKTELQREEICTAEIKKKNTQTKNTEAICKDSIAQIQTFPVPRASGISCIPVTFTINNFRERLKQKGSSWLSPPFYTHVGGYKMCLSVYSNGSRDASQPSLSVSIHFLAGEFDDHLMWPFPGAIFTITVINQHPNECNKSVKLELVGKDTLYIRSKQIDGGLGFGFGVSLHLAISDFLSRDNCFKLKVYRIQFLPL